MHTAWDPSLLVVSNLFTSIDGMEPGAIVPSAKGCALIIHRWKRYTAREENSQAASAPSSVPHGHSGGFHTIAEFGK